MTDLWALLLRPSEDKSAPKGAKTAAAALSVAAAAAAAAAPAAPLLAAVAQLGLTAKPSYHPPARRLKLLQLHDRRRVIQHVGHRVDTRRQRVEPQTQPKYITLSQKHKVS